MVRVLTWIDLQGRYRITSPAYKHLMGHYSAVDDDGNVDEFTEDDVINLVWARITSSGLYGIPFDHPVDLVEGQVLETKIEALGGEGTRYFIDPASGDTRGAWRMDVDGTPRIGTPAELGVI